MTNMIFTLETILILVISLVVVIFIVAAFIVEFWIPFKEERRYLKLEINRTSGNEKKYWERELKKLYLNNVPLAKFFMRKNK